MMNFKAWLAESVMAAKNRLATLVQQGVGSGDKDSWQALLRIVKDKEETQLQALRQIVSGYVNHPGKVGAAAKYLMDTIAELDAAADQSHYGEKAQEAVTDVQEALHKHNVPEPLADALLQVIGEKASGPDFFMQRHGVANRPGMLMRELLPHLVEIAEHLFARHGEQEAKDAMIEILGTMHHFSEQIPTLELVMRRMQSGVV